MKVELAQGAGVDGSSGGCSGSGSGGDGDRGSGENGKGGMVGAAEQAAAGAAGGGDKGLMAYGGWGMMDDDMSSGDEEEGDEEEELDPALPLQWVAAEQVLVLYASWQSTSEVDEYEWHVGKVDTEEQRQMLGKHAGSPLSQQCRSCCCS